MGYKIRKLREDEHSILDDFLYQAIFVEQGELAPPKSIIKNEELQVYIKDFGKRKDDICLVAEMNKKIIGAIWVRIMNDYGHIDDETPSLAMSIDSEYRGLKIGSNLMRTMLLYLKKKGYLKVSLSVQKANYAFKMYRKLGFSIVSESDEEYLMINHLQ